MHDAVMVGIDTVLKDDPSLTVRLVKGRNPRRIIVDSTVRIPLKAKVLSDDKATTTILATYRADEKRVKDVETMRARVLQVKENAEGGVDLRAAFKALARQGITSILVEGGARLATSLLRARLVDELLWVIAPKIMGKGIEAVGDLGIREISQAIPLSVEKTQRAGEDLIVLARLHS
jgi:riboflavin-specific deaminase-like protein